MVVTHATFVNAHINDELGKVWADVLCRNTTITMLNLESNSIATGGMLAIAAVPMAEQIRSLSPARTLTRTVSRTLGPSPNPSP